MSAKIRIIILFVVIAVLIVGFVANKLKQKTVTSADV